MSKRADPERSTWPAVPSTSDASRDAAERAIAASKVEAAARGLVREAPDYWAQGEAWIAERPPARR